MHKLEERFDIFFSKILDITRAEAVKLIKAKDIYLNDKPVKSSMKVKKDDILKIDNDCVVVDENIHLNIQPIKEKIIQNTSKSDIKFYDVDDENLVSVIFEDDDILVVNKPENLATHGASSLNEPSLVDWLLKYKPRLSDVLGKERSGIIHRLDKCTSGILLVAKSNKAHLKLSEDFMSSNIRRIYLALIDRPLKEDKMIVERYITRNEKNRLKKIALTDQAKNAKYSKTLFANLYDFNDKACICAKLFTGKTHQIRAHLESINRHILGDELYGSKAKVERVMLHAFMVGFNHPISGEYMEFLAPIDMKFKSMLNRHFEGEIDEKSIFVWLKSVLDDDF